MPPPSMERIRIRGTREVEMSAAGVVEEGWDMIEETSGKIWEKM